MMTITPAWLPGTGLVAKERVKRGSRGKVTAECIVITKEDKTGMNGWLPEMNGDDGDDEDGQDDDCFT